MEQYVIGNKTLIDNIANNARIQTGDTEPYTIQGLADAVARGGAVQSDYEENDPSSKAYIKNRPFYKELGQSWVLTDGPITFTNSPNEGMEDLYVAEISLPDDYKDNLEKPQQTKIIFKDETYICDQRLISVSIAGMSGGMPIYGNGRILYDAFSSFLSMEEPEDTGESFVLFSSMFIIKDEPSLGDQELNLYIESNVYNITMVPTEFLPKQLMWPGDGSYSIVSNNLSNKASGMYSFASNISCWATEAASHAEGYYTTASGVSSFAQNYITTASGEDSHAEGTITKANGESSHAEGYGTIASSKYQHVQGKGNIEDTEEKYAHIVGNGRVSFNTDLSTRVSTETSDSKRSNAHTLDWNGNARFAGDVYVRGTGTNDLVDAKKLATEEYVDSHSANLEVATSSTLGGVRPVTKTNDMTRSVGIDSYGKLYTTAENAPTSEQVNNAVNAWIDENGLEITRGSYFAEFTMEEAVEEYVIPFETNKYNRYTITVYQPSENRASPSVTIDRDGYSANYLNDTGTSQETYFFIEMVESGNQPNNGTKTMVANVRRSNNIASNTLVMNGLGYLNGKSNGIRVKGTTFAAGTKIFVRCWE